MAALKGIRREKWVMLKEGVHEPNSMQVTAALSALQREGLAQVVARYFERKVFKAPAKKASPYHRTYASRPVRLMLHRASLKADENVAQQLKRSNSFVPEQEQQSSLLG